MAHEAHIQHLKKDLERQQAQQPPRPRVPSLINSDDTQRMKRTQVPRDHTNLLPPGAGDPDDRTPPFTEKIMNAHISIKFTMPTIKTYNRMSDLTNHVRTFSMECFVTSFRCY